MNTIYSTIAGVNYRLAYLLDAVAMRAPKVLPIDGAGVFYRHGLPWSVGNVKEGCSRALWMGGYRPRSIDALRPYLETIEAHILQQAGVAFDATAAPGKLRVLAA